MRHDLFFVLGMSFAFATGCGSEWSANNSKFYKYQNKDVRVASKVTFNEKARVNMSSDGVEYAMRLYTKDYGAVLTEVDQQVGATLEKSGSTGQSEIVTISISDFRLGGTPNTYQDFCAEIRMDRSNVREWTKLGCVNYTDTPNESPTGGIQ